jgi:hypothetical protein
VELTVKDRRRLVAICRGWARCRTIAGVIYLASADVERALLRAIAEAHAGEQIAVVRFGALPGVDVNDDGAPCARGGSERAIRTTHAWEATPHGRPTRVGPPRDASSAWDPPRTPHARRAPTGRLIRVGPPTDAPRA